MSKHKDGTFQVRMTAEELALAKERAKQQGTTLSSVVRRLLRKFIADPEIALDEKDDERAEYDHEHAKSRR